MEKRKEKLIVISYLEFNNIDEILKKELLLNNFKNELIEYFQTNNKNGVKTREISVKKNMPKLYESVIEYNINYNFGNMHFTQKLYNFLFDIKVIPRCPTCGNTIKWKNKFSEGYQNFCSHKCSLEKSLKTIKEKYGVNYYAQTDEWKQKVNSTNIKKYGVNNFFKTNQFKKDLKKQMNEKYGVNYYAQTDEWKEKVKETSNKKYGVNYYSQSNESKEKTKKTIKEKYGKNSLMEVTNIKEKNIISRSNTNIQKFKKILIGDNVEIKLDKDSYIIENSCPIHSTYKIKKTLLYNRIIYANQKNPCIICQPISSLTSFKEKEIVDFIKSNDIICIENDRTILNGKELDIYLPDYNLAIEYNGEYWHSDKFLDEFYHINKLNQCKEKNIELIQIFDNEWNTKKDVVKSIINHKLNLIKTIINPQNFTIKNVEQNKAKSFLDSNTIFGDSNSPINLGLFHDDDLLSIMCFSKVNDNMFSLDCYASINNLIVIEAEMNLFHYFVRRYHPLIVRASINQRYGNNQVLAKLGFKFQMETPPNLIMFKNNKIYDCGTMKFTWQNETF